MSESLALSLYPSSFLSLSFLSRSLFLSIVLSLSRSRAQHPSRICHGGVVFLSNLSLGCWLSEYVIGITDKIQKNLRDHFCGLCMPPGQGGSAHMYFHFLPGRFSSRDTGADQTTNQPTNQPTNQHRGLCANNRRQ